MDKLDDLHNNNLTPANSYMWGHLKGIVYTQWYNTKDELWNVTEATGITIYRVVHKMIQYLIY
jgi:hypothetical protein